MHSKIHIPIITRAKLISCKIQKYKVPKLSKVEIVKWIENSCKTKIVITSISMYQK